MGKEATKRINITFPVSLLEDLRRYTPRRKRNEFIVKATEEELKRERLLRALRGSAGAWSNEDHPDLMTIEDVNRYVRRLRETWVPQSWDEFEKEARRVG
ncbi:hypothetical protein M1N79_02230 [Dehalococcoidia bacterium]|nr:hypothetical protein [Dehalococcoidia bacterium]